MYKEIDDLIKAITEDEIFKEFVKQISYCMMKKL